MVLLSMTGWAQKNGETIWNDVVSGYANTPLIKVTKVVMFDDRTEVSVHIDFVKGQWIRIAENTVLKADGNSNDEAWKNIIKEYNIMGDNVVHYNLPADQQNAVEHFLGVTAFPTYKLIDRDGTILDVNADPRDLDRLANLLERMK